MTPEQRIAHLEAELARERSEKERLLAMLESFTSKKRTAGAERQARYRERHVARSVTSDVTVTRDSDASPPAPSSSPPPSFSLSPPSEPSPSILYPFSPASPPPPPEKRTTSSAAADVQVPLLQVGATPGEQPADLQALWNVEAHPCLPRWQGMSDKRKRQAAARLGERPLQAWREVIRRISTSPFCRGETGGRGWKATPDWLLQADTADRVLEGKYDRSGAAGGNLSDGGVAAVGEECAGCGEVGDGANLQQGGGERLWLGYPCGCCGGWTAEVQAGAHYSGVYEWARNRRAGRAA